MPREVRSVLLVRLGAVGDVIRTLPLAHAIRAAHPSVRLHWVAEPASASLLREIRVIDRVHELPRRALARAAMRPWDWPRAARLLAGLRHEMREDGLDLALDAHGTLKAALVARLAGARATEGFARGGSKEGASLLYDRALAWPGVAMSRVRRALLLGVESGILEGDPASLEARADFGLRFPPERTAAIARFAATDARPLVVLFPFASRRGQGKRWPLPGFVEVARALEADGCRAVLAWGSESERRELAALAPEASLAPRTDLVELSELLRRSRLLITGDTGPMHLAAAVGTRVLALFGPSDPVINRPWGGPHEVIVSRPLAALPADRVLAAARDALRTPGAAAS